MSDNDFKKTYTGFTKFVLWGTIAVIAIISYLEGNNDDPKGINLTKKLFSTDSTFNIAAFGVLLITAFLYALFW